MPQELATLLRQAEDAYQEKKWGSAIDRYFEVIEVDPNNELACTKLADLYAIRGLVSSVIHQYVKLADILENSGEFERAVQILQHVLKLSPLNDKARIKIVEIYRKQNNVQAVVSETLRLARLYIEINDGEKAIDLLKDSQSFVPDNLILGMELAEIYISFGNIQDGVLQFRKIANAYLAKGHVQKAIEAFKKLKVIDPEDLPTISTLGNLYLQIGKLEEAELEFRTILRHDISHTDALISLGKVCKKRGQFRDAILAFNKILSAEPDNLTAKENLGELFDAQGATLQAVKMYVQAGQSNKFNGNLEQAIRFFQRVIALDPGNPIAIRELTDMNAPLTPGDCPVSNDCSKVASIPEIEMETEEDELKILSGEPAPESGISELITTDAETDGEIEEVPVTSLDEFADEIVRPESETPAVKGAVPSAFNEPVGTSPEAAKQDIGDDIEYAGEEEDSQDIEYEESTEKIDETRKTRGLRRKSEGERVGGGLLRKMAPKGPAKKGLSSSAANSLDSHGKVLPKRGGLLNKNKPVTPGGILRKSTDKTREKETLILQNETEIESESIAPEENILPGNVGKDFDIPAAEEREELITDNRGFPEPDIKPVEEGFFENFPVMELQAPVIEEEFAGSRSEDSGETHDKSPEITQTQISDPVPSRDEILEILSEPEEPVSTVSHDSPAVLQSLPIPEEVAKSSLPPSREQQLDIDNDSVNSTLGFKMGVPPVPSYRDSYSSYPLAKLKVRRKAAIPEPVPEPLALHGHDQNSFEMFGSPDDHIEKDNDSSSTGFKKSELSDTPERQTELPAEAGLMIPALQEEESVEIPADDEPENINDKAVLSPAKQKQTSYEEEKESAKVSRENPVDDIFGSFDDIFKLVDEIGGINGDEAPEAVSPDTGKIDEEADISNGPLLPEVSELPVLTESEASPLDDSETVIPEIEDELIKHTEDEEIGLEEEKIRDSDLNDIPSPVSDEILPELPTPQLDSSTEEYNEEADTLPLLQDGSDEPLPLPLPVPGEEHDSVVPAISDEDEIALPLLEEDTLPELEEDAPMSPLPEETPEIPVPLPEEPVQAELLPEEADADLMPELIKSDDLEDLPPTEIPDIPESFPEAVMQETTVDVIDLSDPDAGIYREFEMITSRKNPAIKTVHQLHLKKFRSETGLFIMEGVRCLKEIINADVPVKQLFYSTDIHETEQKTLLKELKKRAEQIFPVTDDILEYISPTESPQKILAVLSQRTWNQEEVIKNGKYFMGLFQVRDPGNLGTIIRSARAFSCGSLILVGDCVDVYNPKVVRASAGYILSMPILQIPTLSRFLQFVMRHKMELSVLSPETDRTIQFPEKPAGKPVFLMGSEASGFGAEIRNFPVNRYRIPMVADVESLNLSVSASIVMSGMYESLLKFN